MTFRGWWIEEDTDDEGRRHQSSALRTLDDDVLNAGAGTGSDTLVDVTASSVNYKDALAVLGKPGVVRRWPLVAGIDVVGTVRESTGSRWKPGDRVVLNGAGLGESMHGGLAEQARVPGGMLVRIPHTFTDRQAAAIGTAGFTAMLGVLAIARHGVQPADGPVLVTGAAGGVGSITIATLAQHGFEVVASTGRADSEGDYLRHLGATEVIDRSELSEPGRALQSQRWAAVADAVGSTTLANALAQTRQGGIVTACGLAQGTDLPTTVMPFILRGVTLAGINSVEATREQREESWNALAHDLDTDLLDEMTTVHTLEEVADVAENLLAGTVRGRSVVAIQNGKNSSHTR